MSSNVLRYVSWKAIGIIRVICGSCKYDNEVIGSEKYAGTSWAGGEAGKWLKQSGSAEGGIERCNGKIYFTHVIFLRLCICTMLSNK